MKSSRQRREELKRLGQLTQAQVALGWAIVLVLIALLGAIYLRQSSHIAELGRRVQLRQNDLIDLKRDNAAIERDIAEAQALERLQAEAAALGFVPARAEDIDYIIVEGYPETTVTPQIETTPIAPVNEPQSMAEAILITIRASIGNLARGEARGE